MHWVATAYVVKHSRVLLGFHPKLGLVLPPGGHLEQGETPHEAAIRETIEETGLRVEIVDSMSTIPSSEPEIRLLATPIGVQLEYLPMCDTHLNFVFAARVVNEGSRLNDSGFEWWTLDQLESSSLTDEVRMYSRRAISAVELR
jgi:8-oxo-dGTP pyrophosphatase MutT (NUDIX family)